MAEGRFDPNRQSFVACTERLQRALNQAGIKTEGRIVTSRDDGIAKLKQPLKVTNIPRGFSKWQLPVYFKDPTHLFISVGQPGAKAPNHSHKEGDGIRFIASGSILYQDKELFAGDWMYIPAGAEYSFEVGEFGATMFYCYAC